MSLSYLNNDNFYICKNGFISKRSQYDVMVRWQNDIDTLITKCNRFTNRYRVIPYFGDQSRQIVIFSITLPFIICCFKLSFFWYSAKFMKIVLWKRLVLLTMWLHFQTFPMIEVYIWIEKTSWGNILLYISHITSCIICSRRSYQEQPG